MNIDNHTLIAQQSSLRERATTLLHARGSGLSVAKDASVALRVLFDLAASPTTAHDALALLHELQVHQVELDLQNEELQSSRAELESAFDRQRLLRDASPSAQLVLDVHGCLLECNAMALTYLKQSLPQVSGKPMTTWVDKTAEPRMQTWLERAQQSNETTSQGFVLRVHGCTDRAIFAAARANPLAPGVLIAWIDAPTS